MAASTGSFSPFWLINGPVTKDLQINSSFGALSPGNIANATIGRALGLITKNIRGVRRQIEDMGVLGNPGKYSMVAAENEELSPWEPMHVEHGFRKEDSTITLTFPQSFQQMVPYGTDDKGILTTVVTSITQARMGLLAVLLTPAHAKSLAGRGWTKKSIKDYIMKNARLTVDYYAAVRRRRHHARGAFHQRRLPMIARLPCHLSQHRTGPRAHPDLLFRRIRLVDGIPSGRAPARDHKSGATEKLGQTGGQVQKCCPFIPAILTEGQPECTEESPEDKGNLHYEANESTNTG